MIPTWEIVLYIFLAIVTTVVVRIGFKFDINEWLKERRTVQQAKLKNMCPHASLGKTDGELFITSHLGSPPGTTQWHCQQCDSVFFNDVLADNIKYWQENPKVLQDQQEAFYKQAKKMGLVP